MKRVKKEIIKTCSNCGNAPFNSKACNTAPCTREEKTNWKPKKTTKKTTKKISKNGNISATIFNVENLTDIEEQIVLYCKGWYGSDRSINGIKKLLSVMCGLTLEYISDDDVLEQLISIYNKVHRNTSIFQKNEWMQELVGTKWRGNFSGFNRSPFSVLVGAISVCDGDFVRKVKTLAKIQDILK